MKSQDKAFTLIELIVVIAVVGVLGAMLLPALASAKGNSQKITCINNLKQVGLAFRTWEGSHSDKYPMAVSSAAGGASEYLAHSSATASSTPTPPASSRYIPGVVYMVMSNQLASPNVVFCPSDNIHPYAATNFSFGSLLGSTGIYANQPGEPSGSIGSKISYFVNADATEANPRDIMTGDDNIGNYAASASQPASFRFGASASSPLVPSASPATCMGITSAAFGGGGTYWSWTGYDFHQKSGNLGFADGSCQSTTIPGLQYYLSNSTNSAAAEAVNFMP